ncbi:MAG: DUF2225 domain-containing protein [Fibrobacteres bacterium]|nr:DUF2225 domain-containing protein [Fibrobacterota bacterium]
MGFDDKLVRKKLEVLLKDDTLVEKYLRVFGPRLDMGNVAKLKQEQIRSTASEGVAGDKDDPTYRIMLKCPICNQADITCFELKAKSLTSALDRFQVPRYTGVKPFRSVNYSLFAVTVCPSCLFASPDKRDFVTFSVQARAENKSQLSPFVLDELRKRIDDRKKIVPAPDLAAFFSHPRSPEAGIASYRLAIHRALAEASLETPLAWYKAGMYGLKIALLQRDTGKDDTDILKESAKYLANSFRASELKLPDLECQLVYVLAALFLRLGEQTQCQSYLGVLEKWKGEVAKGQSQNPDLTAAHVDRWLDKAKELWTDRELPDLWTH